MATRLLKPGLLVSLKTTIRGGVDYRRVDLDAVRKSNNGEAVTRWETTRTIEDPEEHERAVKVRGKANGLIRGVCSFTSFGLLCPYDREERLDSAIEEARRLTEDFNSTATHSDVSVYVLRGRIAETDEEATRALVSEVQGLLSAMESGIRGGEVKTIR